MILEKDRHFGKDNRVQNYEICMQTLMMETWRILSAHPQIWRIWGRSFFVVHYVQIFFFILFHFYQSALVNPVFNDFLRKPYQNITSIYYIYLYLLKINHFWMQWISPHLIWMPTSITTKRGEKHSGPFCSIHPCIHTVLNGEKWTSLVFTSLF